MKTRTQYPQIQLLHDRKSLCSTFGNSTVRAILSLALLLGFSFTAPAFVLDNFTGAITDWTSISNAGSVYQSGGSFTVAAAAVANSRTSSKKTSLAFSNEATHTLEFRVLVNSISGPGQAVLGWVPTGGALGTNGYALCVGTNRVTILANSTVLYTTNEFVRMYADTVLHDNFVLPSSDMYLAMRMTPDGANMIVKSTVYKKGDGRTNLLFEITVTNTVTPLIGTEGNASLGAFNDGSATATSANFDDLHYFDTVRVVIDDFSGAYPGVGWTDFTEGNNGGPTGSTNYVSGGSLKTVSATTPGIVSGTYRSDKVFKLTDGVRLELRVDNLDLGAGGFDLSVLGYIPHGLIDFSTLSEYFNAYSIGVIYLGKAVTSIYENGNQNFPYPQFNVRAIQTLTCEGTTVRIESRAEDLSKDVNDPARVLHQYMRVDSSSPYIGFNGNFAITRYRLGGAGGEISVYDNAEVNKVAGASPPIVTTRTPADGKAFHPAQSGLSFNVVGDTNIPVDNIKLVFNGVAHTNGTPGVTITPPGGSATLRTFTFTNLATNVFFKGSIIVTDAAGLSIDDHWEFSTFLTNNLQVEAEDFNYSDNVGVTGGKFIDGGLNAYAGLEGTKDIDFFDRTDTSTDYRVFQGVEISPTGDPARAQYVAASQPEYIVTDNENDNWRNYTRSFASGTYHVYSRQSAYAIPAGSLCTLERVISDSTTSNQVTVGLGIFQQQGDIAGNTGFDLHRFVQLTDVSGNPAVVRFGTGLSNTVRFSDRYVDDGDDSDIFHNYLIFVPTADPGTLRPIVANMAPAPGDTFRSGPATGRTFASIANRDTTVTNVVAFRMNGVNVPFTNTATPGGIDVDWSFASVPATPTITNTLIYKDSQGVSITNTWTYGYRFLYATNRLVGGLPVRAFAFRVVQTDIIEPHNDLATAEEQLSTPPVIAPDRSWATNVSVLQWNDDSGVPSYIPGLDGGISGYAPGPYDNIATEALGYMYLTAGAHRFRIDCDDGFEVSSGTTILARRNGGYGNTFDVVAEAEGLYPVRCIWFEDGGAAHYRFQQVNLSDNSTFNVNDPSNPAGVVKVFAPALPIQLHSSATVNGPYSLRTDAVFDSDAKTITVPVSVSAQYYRLTSDSTYGPITINKVVAIVGSNVVIKYQ